ncbi:hypothetical protein V6N11_004322 [Hibiscus sabdariffa]|uniref:Uncharacterized protein n=1 Tax=Hibiscus sabdariffa TaxID=183260 RepID=A0ABR2SFZ2_9ROSI
MTQLRRAVYRRRTDDPKDGFSSARRREFGSSVRASNGRRTVAKTEEKREAAVWVLTEPLNGFLAQTAALSREWRTGDGLRGGAAPGGSGGYAHGRAVAGIEWWPG